MLNIRKFFLSVEEEFTENFTTEDKYDDGIVYIVD
jgi:hypothetical protein